MKFSTDNLVMALGFIVIGVSIGIIGFLFGELDDVPVISLIGILMMIGITSLGVKRVMGVKRFS